MDVLRRVPKSAGRHLSTSTDPYAVLGVTRSASALDLKTAYRKLAMQTHPDRNREDGAAQKFRSITAAYTSISSAATPTAQPKLAFSVLALQNTEKLCESACESVERTFTKHTQPTK